MKNSANEFQVCIDRVFDDEHQEFAQTVATRENPANDPRNRPPTRIALVTAKKWNPSRKLRLRFLDGTATMQKSVIRAAQPWIDEANVDFDFGDDPQAEIRISFHADPGSWSALGTDALVEAWFPKYQPTMNFGWLRDGTPADEYARVVLHELGHALGCIHEHQNPAASIQWDEDAVYRYFSGPPGYWSRAKIKANVLDGYARSVTQFTEFDPTSIMVYGIPTALTLNGASIGQSSKLSATDVAFIRQQYPR
jgi:hypothetical protein